MISIERVPNNGASNWANSSSQHFSPNYKHVFMGLDNYVGISFQDIREYGIPEHHECSAVLTILVLLWLHTSQTTTSCSYIITSRYALLQGYMRVGHSPQCIYYELLIPLRCLQVNDTLRDSLVPPKVDCTI